MGSGDHQVTGIGRWPLFRVFLRSFFIQGSFSAKYRQNLGFVHCLEPVGKCLWNSPGEYRRFLARHSEYFNGNPFMATLILGAVIQMEERFRSGDGISEEDIRRFKNILGPASGAVGDRLFWSNLRPFTLLVGISCALAYGFWGAILFLGLFNAVVCYVKLRWLYTGYRLGPKVVVEIRNDVIDRAEKYMEMSGCVLAGFAACGLIVAIAPSPLPVSILLGGPACMFLFSLVLFTRNIPLHLAFSCASVVALILGIFSRALW